jgi:hypothetical protein
MMPALFSVIALFLIGLSAISFKNTGDLPKWRWISLVFLAAALFFGLSWSWRMLDPSAEVYAYRLTVTTRVMEFAHFAAALIPITLIGQYFLVDRQMRAKAALDT